MRGISCLAEGPVSFSGRNRLHSVRSVVSYQMHRINTDCEVLRMTIFIRAEAPAA